MEMEMTVLYQCWGKYVLSFLQTYDWSLFVNLYLTANNGNDNSLVICQGIAADASVEPRSQVEEG
jgi:hypothetical protein